jgi:Tol biopolymer transport system component
MARMNPRYHLRDMRGGVFLYSCPARQPRIRGALGLSLCLVTHLVACNARSVTPPVEPKRFPLSVPVDRSLRTFAVSNDGRWLAYSAENAADQRLHLYLRRLDEGGREGGESEREVAGSTGAHNPFFSPDGNAIAFFSRGSIWRIATAATVPADGPQKIADAPSETAGATWTEDGRIIFAPLGNQGLAVVPEKGGLVTPLTVLSPGKGELEHGWPHVLPDGAVLFTVTERGHDPHLEVLSMRGERTRLPVPVVGQAQFVSSGHLVYSYFGDLFVIGFDAEKGQTRGVPIAVAKGVQTVLGFGNLGRAGFAVSRTGTLIWLPGTTEDVRSRLVRVDRTGRYTPLPAPAEIYQSPRLSPDGRHLAVVVRPGVMTRDIRVLDMLRPEHVVLTLEGGDNQSPSWMRDGRLTFGSNREGIQKIYVVGLTSRTREPKPLFSIGVAVPRVPTSWARNVPLLAFYEIDPMRRRDVMLYRVDESVTPVVATAANERSPVLSPDGRLIAYVSDESGRDEIYLQSVDGGSPATRLTVTGGIEPVWTREGLFYRSGDSVMLAVWKDGKATATEVLDGLFERDPGANVAAYDVDPAGHFLLMLKSASAPRQLRIVTNWGTELARMVPNRP